MMRNLLKLGRRLKRALAPKTPRHVKTWRRKKMTFQKANTFCPKQFPKRIVTLPQSPAQYFSGNGTRRQLTILLAFWMMLGIIQMPSIKSCFSKLPLLRMEVFRSLLTERRYWNLNRALHLASGSSQDNPLHPMGPVLDHAISRTVIGSRHLYR